MDFKLQHGKNSRENLGDPSLMCNPSEVFFEDKEAREVKGLGCVTGWLDNGYKAKVAESILHNLEKVSQVEDWKR